MRNNGEEDRGGVPLPLHHAALSRVCVHGRGRTTQDNADTARESTERSEVAAPLTVPAAAAEERCRSILYVGTTIKVI